MLKHRVIPCVLLKDWQLTKSVGFEEFRTIGHPKVTSKIYNRRNVDELIVLDIDASNLEKSINYKTLSDIAQECFMPLTLGGGIRSLEDINKLLEIGADKVSLNTIALKKPDFIKEASVKYGSQCIVISIDVIKEEQCYKIYNKNLGVVHDLDLRLWMHTCERLGAGEILLTSVDHDGRECGYDVDLIALVAKEVNIPIIANGGAGNPLHAVDAIRAGADAIAAASIFHFTQYTPDNIKEVLQKANLPVRL
ncbi:MAG: imidazole glycerol phosphate synthase subunit HisF [Epsilonproteobacteria bacterium]|nr:imidazole glycerol phosphate synthase subunit HisF [Campylobacterota bacterium]